MMPVVTVQDLTDPTRIAELMALRQDVVVLGRARFRVRRITVRFNRSLLVFHSSTHRLRTLTHLTGDNVAFHAIGDQSAARIGGLAIRSGTLTALRWGVDVEIIVEPRYESVAWMVPRDVLRSHLVARKREIDFQIPDGVEILEADSELVRYFFDMGKSICHSADLSRDLFENKSILSAAELSIAESLFTCLGSAASPELGSAESTPQYYSELVRKAEQYTLDHPARRPTISELCESINVGERTLQNAFQDIIGMSPNAFLTRLRLHRARRDLQSASYNSMTVSAVAQDWGFWHFSNFSKAYKECFSELPSETLRRQRRSVVGSGGVFSRFEAMI